MKFPDRNAIDTACLAAQGMCSEGRSIRMDVDTDRVIISLIPDSPGEQIAPPVVKITWTGIEEQLDVWA
jgi:hypothetical protein